jgi:hypothetical protein
VEVRVILALMVAVVLAWLLEVVLAGQILAVAGVLLALGNLPVVLAALASSLFGIKWLNLGEFKWRILQK